MKLAVLFLIIFVGTSYQQQLQRVAWMSSNDGLFMYPSHNNYQKLGYYNNRYNQPFAEPADDFSFQPTPVFTRYNRPSYYSTPNPYQRWFIAVSGKQRFQNSIGGYYYPFSNNQNNGDRFSYVSSAEFEDDHNNDDSEWMANNHNLGIQSRRKLKPALAAPKIPLMTSDPIEQRFFFNWGNPENIILVSNTSEYRPFAQTVGIVTTQTVNITNVVTCIASNQFTVGFTTCSRRKRAAIERFRLPDEGEDSIHPSTVLKIESTASPEQELMEKRNAELNELIASSKDDLILVDSAEEDLLNKEKDAGLSASRGRGKRFFWYTTTKTLTSYVFTTTISYKKITLLSTVQSSSLICIPSGFVVCTF